MRILGLEITKAKAAPIPPQGDDVELLYPRNRHAYIYALSDPRTNQVRYIGKTFNPNGRFYDHKRARGKTHKDCWIKGLKAAGLSPDMDVIDILDAGNEAGFFQAEKNWIETFRAMGCNLTNLMEGGGSGGKHTDETIARMRVAQNNRSEETKAKNAAVAAARRGRKHKPESIEKMRASHSVISEETRKRMSLAHSSISEESRARMSAGQRRRFQDPMARAALSAYSCKNIGKRRTPEQCARISAGKRAAMARKVTA